VSQFSQDPIINVIHNSIRKLFRPEFHSKYVMVSIVELKDAVFRGIDRFLIKLYKDPKSKEAQLADKRFQSFVHKMPTGEATSGTQ
jgi:hypothetical protein